MTSIDLGCGDNKVNTHFVGVDRHKTTQSDIISEADDLSCLETSSVHVVFSRRCIQHVVEDVKVFSEINRVLAPDGIAVIEVASVSNALVSKALNRLGFKKHPYPHFHVYTRKGLRKKLEAGGLKIVSLSFAPTETPLFRNHVAVCTKGQLA